MQLEKTCQEHCQIQCILYTVYLYANNNAAIHHSCLLVDLHTELQLCINDAFTTQHERLMKAYAYMIQYWQTS